MLSLIMATGFVLAQADGCSKDIDCKGERVCENRECVAPPSPTPGVEPAVAIQPIPAPPRPAAPATPQTVLAAEPEHRHRGLFLRPDLGFGYISASASDPSSSVTISGGAASIGFAIGGSITDGVILAGHLWGIGAVNPSIAINGQSGTSTNTNVSFAAIGPELDYYVMPLNLFISVTVAASRGRTTVNGTDYDSEIGIAGQAALGKEWWVSEHWGLGLKGEFTVTSNKDSAAANAPTWTGYAFGVSFSATYN